MGKRTMNLAYTKDQLNFPSFNVWYKYKTANQQLLDSWEEKRMTGFRLSWRIENPTVKWTTSISEIGTSLQTPRLGDAFVKPHDRSSDHAYKAILTKDFNEEEIGNGTLVIELDVNMREGDKVALTSYKLYEEGKTWVDAETHCKREGGHLASIHSELEQA